MASATDFLNELKGANSRLDGVNTRLDAITTRIDGTNTRLDTVNNKLDALKASTDAVRAAVEQVDKTLQWGFTELITLGIYTNQALAQNAKQNDTMICILEHISQNTCSLLNESHLQTGLQTNINKNTTLLADLYAATHADAALTRERMEELRKQIEVCCPPRLPEPVCGYVPCDKPDRLGDPPRVDPQPPREGPN